MIRFAILILMAVGLVSCGEQGPSIEGKWGWFNLNACEGDTDTLEFTANSFVHRRNGEAFVTGRDVAYQTNEQGWVSVTYIVDNDNGRSRIISLTFEPSTAERRNPEGELLATYNVLVFRGSVIDGVSPENAANAIGRPLFGCE